MTEFLKAKGNNVVVRRMKPKTETDGGLAIPEEHQKDTYEGIVVSVGQLVPADYVGIGDHVMFNKYVGDDGPSPDPQDEEYLVMPYDAIKAGIDLSALEAEKARRREAAAASEAAAAASLEAERAALRASPA